MAKNPMINFFRKDQYDDTRQQFNSSEEERMENMILEWILTIRKLKNKESNKKSKKFYYIGDWAEIPAYHKT